MKTLLCWRNFSCIVRFEILNFLWTNPSSTIRVFIEIWDYFPDNFFKISRFRRPYNGIWQNSPWTRCHPFGQWRRSVIAADCSSSSYYASTLGPNRALLDHLDSSLRHDVLLGNWRKCQDPWYVEKITRLVGNAWRNRFNSSYRCTQGELHGQNFNALNKVWPFTKFKVTAFPCH